jgi:CRP-like cAMP-binding protein
MQSRSHLARKLGFGAELTQGDVDRLDRIATIGREVPPGGDLISEGDGAGFVHIVHSGIACRYKILPDGNRAIVALLLPGDFCDLHVSILGRMDHSIGALTECVVSRLLPEDLDEMLRLHPNINRACLWASLVDEAVLREWIVNIGHRNSEKALAHLFCELYTRLGAVGLIYDHSFRMPFTHATLGDLLGISQVHIQRTMSGLRNAGLISVQEQIIQMPDFERLSRLGEFDPAYLHLGRWRNR